MVAHMDSSLLDTIISHKREELENRKRAQPLPHLQEQLATDTAPTRNLKRAITSDQNLAIIAEIKRTSPSSGIIKPDFNHIYIAQEYARAKVNAISILTDQHFFMGKLSFINDVKQVAESPILQKDFVIDSYQIYESRLYGADAILLLAGILDSEQLAEYRELAEGLGLQCLVECHNEQHIDQALNSGATIIGINNRDLDTFGIDLSAFAHLRSLIPPGHTVISESGISSADDARQMKRAGADAILVGTSIMAADDIGAKINELRV